MSRMHTKRSLHCAVGLVPLLAACYSQRPLTTAVPAATTRIVAQITDSGVVAMSNAIGAGATEVEGVVAAADAVSWDLQVIRVDYRGGASVLWNREPVNFPRYTLTHATERTLDKKKSWIAGGLITAGALLAARVFGAFGFGDNPGTEPPPPN
jgi:hypothetical protein